jgi:hypothetical protein
MVSMEFSNKTLAWLVVATIVISMAGTMISLNKINSGVTGYATSNTTGNVSVTVATSTVLQFVSANLNLGTGEVVISESNCTLYMDNTTKNPTTYNISRVDWNDCEGFLNTTSDGTLVLENAGNTVLNVTLNFSGNAAAFIGGGASGSATAPAVMFKINNNESTSCALLNASLNSSTWTNATTTTTGTTMTICNGLSWTNANDTILIGMYISIPVDASGSKQFNITAQGTG